jgi:hypothetical protein
MSGITRRGFVKGAALTPLALSPFSAVAQRAATSDRFDIVVAGAGHNSLITAAYLAKAGFSEDCQRLRLTEPTELRYSQRKRIL